MIKDFSKFRLMTKLRYFTFDWDDNILNMPTKIQMDYLENSYWVPVSVSPSDFAKVRSNENYRIRNNKPLEAFLEFKDIGPRGGNGFIEDCQYAIDAGNFGPSWQDYKQCLIEGSIFAIITARGHEYETIKNGVKYTIDNCLTEDEKDQMYLNCLEYISLFGKEKNYTRNAKKFTDNKLIEHYLDCCKFYAVGSPYSTSFKTEFNLPDNTSIEECKQLALGRFIDICNEYGKSLNLGVSIGFSDDDKKNVEHIKKFFENKSTEHINLQLNVYDTSTKDRFRTKYVNGLKEDMGSDLGNTQAKLLRFDSFNSQSRILQNSTTDFTGYNTQQQAKVATNMYKNSLKKKKRKAIKKATK